MRFPTLAERLLGIPLREAAPRSVTVTKLRDPGSPFPNGIPMIRLRGKWLRELGFEEGCIVRVFTAQGEIRLTVERPEAPRTAGQGELF